jgi:hypothetical protein
MLLRSSAGVNANFNYYNWDNIEDREKILRGYKHLTAPTNLDVVSYQKPILALDEIHTDTSLLYPL